MLESWITERSAGELREFLDRGRIEIAGQTYRSNFVPRVINEQWVQAESVDVLAGQTHLGVTATDLMTVDELHVLIREVAGLIPQDQAKGITINGQERLGSEYANLVAVRGRDQSLVETYTIACSISVSTTTITNGRLFSRKCSNRRYSIL